jgi:hypothetical protein
VGSVHKMTFFDQAPTVTKLEAIKNDHLDLGIGISSLEQTNSNEKGNFFDQASTITKLETINNVQPAFNHGSSDNFRNSLPKQTNPGMKMTFFDQTQSVKKLNEKKPAFPIHEPHHQKHLLSIHQALQSHVQNILHSHNENEEQNKP